MLLCDSRRENQTFFLRTKEQNLSISDPKGPQRTVESVVVERLWEGPAWREAKNGALTDPSPSLTPPLPLLPPFDQSTSAFYVGVPH